MDVLWLHAKLANVAPITGVSIGDEADRSTWTIWFDDAATLEQRAAAQAVIGAFDPTSPPAPRSVKMWQAKAALDAAGKIDAANAAVAAHGGAVAFAWEYAPDISRDSPAIAAVGAAIGLDEAAIDSLFIAASQISI